MANLSISEEINQEIQQGKCEWEVKVLFNILKERVEDKRVRLGVLSFIAMNIEHESIFSILCKESAWIVNNFKERAISLEEHERLVHIL